MHADWIDLFRLFEENGVKYLVIGGYAVGFHGFERYTKDLDVWLTPTKANARAALRSLRAFGVAPQGLSESDLSSPETIVMIGVEPYRIDFLTGPAGGEFASAWRRRVRHERSGVTINYVGLDDLIALKTAADRDVDRRDVDALTVAREVRDDPETAPRLPEAVGESVSNAAKDAARRKRTKGRKPPRAPRNGRKAGR